MNGQTDEKSAAKQRRAAARFLPLGSARTISSGAAVATGGLVETVGNWVANRDELTTRRNVVDIVIDGDVFREDVTITNVSSDSQHGEFVEIVGGGGRFYKKNYQLRTSRR